MKTIIDFLKYVIATADPASMMFIPLLFGCVGGLFYCICWTLHHFFIA